MQSVSFFQIGVFVGCVIVIVGLALGLKLLLQRNPPLHKEYISREEHAAFAKKVDDELGRERGARKKIHEEISALTSAVEVVKEQNIQQSRSLSDIKTEQAAIKREVKEDNQAVQSRISDVLEGIAELRGEIKARLNP